MRPCPPAEEPHDQPAGRRQPEPPRRPARDPYGLLPTGMPIAAAGLDRGPARHRHRHAQPDQRQPAVHAGRRWQRAAGKRRGPARTPTPSNVVIVPSMEVPASRSRDAGLREGRQHLDPDRRPGDAADAPKGATTRCRRSRPDGKFVYFVRTRQADGKWSIDGVVKDYPLNVPTLMRVTSPTARRTACSTASSTRPAASSGTGSSASRSSRPTAATSRWRPTCPTRPRATSRSSCSTPRHDKIGDLKLNQVAPLGHQDPAWKPDGSKLLYVRNDRDGAKGTPRIYAWYPDTGKTRPSPGPGTCSPRGRRTAGTSPPRRRRRTGPTS